MGTFVRLIRWVIAGWAIAWLFDVARQNRRRMHELLEALDEGVVSGRPARALNGPAPMRRPSAGWGEARGPGNGATSAIRASYPNEWGVRTTPLSPAETAAAIAYEAELASWALEGHAADAAAARAEALDGLRSHLTAGQ